MICDIKYKFEENIDHLTSTLIDYFDHLFNFIKFPLK
jgi:hypothetical protein